MGIRQSWRAHGLVALTADTYDSVSQSMPLEQKPQFAYPGKPPLLPESVLYQLKSSSTLRSAPPVATYSSQSSPVVLS